MRLLITTQTVDLDDPVLGFFHRWIEEFSIHYASVEVICLREGRHTLPTNVRVHSLGKENRKKKTENRTVGRARYAWRFLRLAWRLRRAYDAVFVHMNPEYAALGGLLWRAQGKRVVLWYTHRNVDLKLRLAVRLADAVASAAPESLRIASDKVHIVGHGIDTARFAVSRDGSLHTPAAIVSVGRITPIKRLEILLEALALLRRRGLPIRLSLVGAPAVPSDRDYAQGLRELARSLAIDMHLRFAGAVPYERMPQIYREHDISVNLAPTGGIDKAVLEAMAAGCIPLVANRAFAPFFGADAGTLLFDGSAEDLARTLSELIALSETARAELSARLGASARAQADIDSVVGRLVALLAHD